MKMKLFILGIIIFSIILGSLSSTHDEFIWQVASIRNSELSYSEYLDVKPEGKYVSEANIRLENINWQEAVNINTIRSLLSYNQKYPKGMYIQEAKKRIRELKLDSQLFNEVALDKTSVNAFLRNYPGHIKEDEARQIINDITQFREIFDLLQENKIEIKMHGAGIRRVIVELRKLTQYPLSLKIPIASYFVSKNKSTQNMVSTDKVDVTIKGNDWLSISVPSACANLPLNIPNTNDVFSIQRLQDNKELVNLLMELKMADVKFATQQAAIWIITNDASWKRLGKLSTDYGRSRVIKYDHAAQAMMIVDKAGIDITKKRIWRDSRLIFNHAGYGARDWFKEKVNIDLVLAQLKSIKRSERLKALRTLEYDRDSGIEVLVQLNDPRVVKPLTELLKDRDSKIRKEAAWALGIYKDSRAIEHLIKALDDDNKHVRRKAISSLNGFNDSRLVKHLIKELLTHRDYLIRYEAAELLGNLNDPQAIEPLMSALNDRSIIVRRAAAVSIGKIGDETAIELLNIVLQNTSEQSPLSNDIRTAIKRIKSLTK